jgi:N-acyl-D-aspartate/D-glutamate deacylase
LNVVNWGNKLIDETFAPPNKRYEGRIVADIAAEEGKSAFDALLDIVCRDELRTIFCRVPPPITAEDWAARQEIWRDPRTVIGASDAGAHLDYLATFNYPTYMLGTVVREVGVLTLEETVAMLTSAPADLYGLRDRGRLIEGANADVVIFDESLVASERVATRYDLPSGAGRLYAEAVGIDAVFVNGEEIVHDGAFTEARPGTLLRSGRDTVTPSMAL